MPTSGGGRVSDLAIAKVLAVRTSAAATLHQVLLSRSSLPGRLMSINLFKWVAKLTARCESLTGLVHQPQTTFTGSGGRVKL